MTRLTGFAILRIRTGALATRTATLPTWATNRTGAGTTRATGRRTSADTSASTIQVPATAHGAGAGGAGAGVGAGVGDGAGIGANQGQLNPIRARGADATNAAGAGADTAHEPPLQDERPCRASATGVNSNAKHARIRIRYRGRIAFPLGKKVHSTDQLAPSAIASIIWASGTIVGVAALI